MQRVVCLNRGWLVHGLQGTLRKWVCAMQSMVCPTERVIDACCRIPFMDAVRGTRVKTSLKGGVDVDIPAGVPCPAG